MSNIPTSVPLQEPALAASAPFATSSDQTAPVAAAEPTAASAPSEAANDKDTATTTDDAPAPFQTGTPANEDLTRSAMEATGEAQADLATVSEPAELAAAGPAPTPQEVAQEPKPIPTTPAPATGPIVESIEKAQHNTTNGNTHNKDNHSEAVSASAPGDEAHSPATGSDAAAASTSGSTETPAKSESVVDKVEQAKEAVVDTVNNGEPATGDERPLDTAEGQEKAAETESMSVDTPEKAPSSEAAPADPDPVPTVAAESAAETEEPPVKKAKKAAPENPTVAPTRRSSRSTRSTASLAE